MTVLGRAPVRTPRDLAGGRVLLGASVYPELLDVEQRLELLDKLAALGCNVLRVGESSWGNLQPAPDRFEFGWLDDFVAAAAARDFSVILGTGSYIPPQWLASDPAVRVRPHPAEMIHPMSRKAACLNNDKYRDACRSFVLSLGRHYGGHPAVLGWQVDNEIETAMPICYCDACTEAWKGWLRREFGDEAAFNERLFLVSWGMSISSFDGLPQPSPTFESTQLPALSLVHRRFRRDVVFNFLQLQVDALREAGATQWVTTDWNVVFDGLSDDPRVAETLDFAGLNYYPPVDEATDGWGRPAEPSFFVSTAWHQDRVRSAHGLGGWLLTETRIGTMGTTVVVDPFPREDQFRMWLLQALAFGAFGLLFWSGNRWRGGHWPHWGGLLDWSGVEEIEAPWVREFSAVLRRIGPQVLDTTVQASAVVLTDFEQRSMLSLYPHTPENLAGVATVIDALHRLGIGVDCLSPARLSADRLEAYEVALLAPTPFVDDGVSAMLEQFVVSGGKVVVMPGSGYQDRDGVFLRGGLGSGLSAITGVSSHTVRRSDFELRTGQVLQVRWTGQDRPVMTTGFLEPFRGVAATTLATYDAPGDVIDGRPAAVERRPDVGTGAALKLGFWPAGDSFGALLGRWLGGEHFLVEPAPPGVFVVPRDDGSHFVVNTTAKPAWLRTLRPSIDRIGGSPHGTTMALAPFEVLWLEPAQSERATGQP